MVPIKKYEDEDGNSWIMKTYEDHCENYTESHPSKGIPTYEDEDGNSWIMKSYEEYCENYN